MTDMPGIAVLTFVRLKRLMVFLSQCLSRTFSRPLRIPALAQATGPFVAGTQHVEQERFHNDTSSQSYFQPRIWGDVQIALINPQSGTRDYTAMRAMGSPQLE